MRKGITLLLCFSLLATACGIQSTSKSPETPLTAEPTPVGSGIQRNEAAAPQETTEVPPALEVEAKAKPELQRDYYMSANYTIKPKEEGGGEPKVVLLTFDDGPKEAEQLESMLETLDKHGASAIFFINGYRALKQPELVQKMVDRGHTVGNHSWDHIDLKKQTNEVVDKQLEDVQQLIKEITGEAPVFFRPPFGSSSEYVKAKAKEEGMLFMTWSNGSKDWLKGYDKPNKVVESVLEQLHPGSNILMHELPWTAEALDSLLTVLKEKGYGFVNPKAIDTTYSKN